MDLTSKYHAWRDNTQGIVGDGQCVSLIVNNSRAYIEALFPGISWPTIIPSVVGAKDMAGVNNAYVTWVENDHNNPNQVPPIGAVMVFDATPQPGYGNQYNNPYGHTGICDAVNGDGFDLCQQNAPSSGQGKNVTHYSWKFRKCLGWLIPNVASAPIPSPTPAPAGHTITLPQTTGPWHLYPVGGPYNPHGTVKGLLQPMALGRDLTYPIDNNRGNGIYTITSQDFGQGDIWTNGSYVVVN